MVTVTVSPIQTINVRVNPQNQQIVQSSSQFVGSQSSNLQSEITQAENLANSALTQSNTAIVLAQAAFNTANNALANTTGTFGGDLTITGNLNVQGTTVTVNKEIINQTETVTGQFTANAGIASVNTTTGSIVVTGGLGVSGNVYSTGVYDKGIELLAYANTINNTAQAAFNAANNVSAIGNTIVLGSNTAGLLVSNAVSLTTSTSITNGIAEINQILGKLVPSAPATFPGSYGTLTITGLVGPYLMANFTQQDNTNLSTSPVVSGGTAVSPLRTSSYTTSTIYLINTQSGDVMSVYKNNAISGTKTMTAGATNAGTYGDLHILTNVDYASTGSISYANFWYSANVNASGTVANGWNTVYITDTSGTKTANATWYYDNSSPGTPTFSNTVMVPGSVSLTYSSNVPHYNSSTTFNLSTAVNKLSGDMYPNSSTLLNSYSAGGAFNAPTSVSYATAGVSTPLARNLYVSSGSVTVNTTSSIISGFGSSSSGPQAYVNNSYNTGYVTYSPANTVLYKTGTSSSMEETNITIGSTIGVGSGSAYRIVNPGSTDTPSYSGSEAAFNSQTGPFYAYDATIVGGILKNDTTNYSTGYLPVGPNLSSQNANQYFTFKFVRTSVSKFNIEYTGTIAGLWVALPGSVIDTSSGLNGWTSMGTAYAGSGYPGTNSGGNGSNSCALGGTAVLGSSVTNGSYTCTFGTVSSSSTATNEIYVRIKLTAGQSLTALSLQTASN